MAATALLESPDAAVRPESEPWDDDSFEIVDGQRIEIAPMSAYAGKIASRLVRKLGVFADDQQLGEVVGEVLFRLPLTQDSGRNRKPDVAFVSSRRWPPDRPQPLGDNAWDVVPELTIEVASPTDSGTDLLGKVREYFQAGVRLVWIVYPCQRCIHVFEAWDRIRVVTESDTVDGSEVLPGFHLPLDRLFDPITPAASEDT
jgi:Uma2 family endonuclease